MTRNIDIILSLPENANRFLRQQVDDGRFQSLDEAILAGVNLLKTAFAKHADVPLADDTPPDAGADRLSDTIIRSAIGFAIISFDLAGRVTSWNEGARRIFGWTEAEMLGVSAEQIFTPEDVANGRPATEMRDALTKGHGKDERWHLRSDGRRFWAAGEMFALRTVSGEPIGFMKMLRDRTEQHQVMRDLLDERTRTEIAADTGLISFFDWNVDTRIMRGDKRFAELYGFDPGAVDAGLPLGDYLARVHRDDRATFQTLAGAAVDSVSEYTQQYRIHGHGGDDRHVIVRARCTLQDGKRAMRFIGVAIDVTAAKLAETARNDTEEFNRRVLAASSDCIKVLDLDGSLRFMSEGGLRVMEVDDIGPIVGSSWLDRWAGDARLLAQAALDAARSGETGHFSAPAPTAKGNLRFWDVVVTPINGPDGLPERLLVISRDMTRVHEAERELRASDGRWRDVFEKLNEGIIVGQVVRDAAGRITDWLYIDVNDAWGRLVGIDARTAVGHTIRNLFPGIEESWIDQVADVVDKNKTGVFTRQVGNLKRWYEGRIYPADGDRFYIIFIEITGRVRAEALNHSLQRLSDRLLVAATGSEMAVAATETIGNALDVSCVGYGTAASDGEHIEIGQAWSAPGIMAIAGNHRLSAYGSRLRELQAGTFVAVADIAKESCLHDSTCTLPGFQALLGVPVAEQGRLDALLVVLDVHPREWSDEDIAFVRNVAQRTQDAIERRRAEQELKDAERLRIALADLSDRLRNVEDLNALQFAASEVIGVTLHADRAGFGRVLQDNQTFDVPNDWTRADFPSLAGRYQLDDYGLYANELRAGQTVVIEDIESDWRTADNIEPLKRLHVGSLINHPVVEHGRTVAVLYINNASRRTWSASEVEFVRESADRLRQASERRYAEISLKNLNARLEYEIEIRTAERNRMWKISPDLMVILSTDGYYRETNPRWASLLGYAPDELSGLYATSLVHPDDIAATNKALRVASQHLLPVFENRLAHKDGSYRWFQWAVAPSGDEVFGTGRDITEAKAAREKLEQAEEQLRQSQKMEAVGQLTGGLSHDFNNLLAAISGSIDMIKIRIYQGRIDDLSRYIDTARGAVLRAAALTHRLLAFSRRQALDPKVTALNTLVEGMRELIQRTVGPAITFEVATAVHTWPILVDQSQLENALLNLCINARDAMPDGGTIRVETSNTHFDEDDAMHLAMPSGDYVTLSVTDTGTGMPPEIVKRVFEPFFTTKPMGEGTGLGLSMIYGFASQSGGQVKIDSEVGRGTTVCIHLPRHHGDVDREEDTQQALLSPGLKRNARILIVDDEPGVRLLLGDIVEELGYSALEAENGRDGLGFLESDERIDLLVTDVGLPGGISGRQLADAARVKHPGLKVLFITGYAENAAFENDQPRAGMEVMTKPFAMDSIGARIRSLIEGG